MFKSRLLLLSFILVSFSPFAQNNSIKRPNHRCEIGIKYKHSIGKQTQNPVTGENQFNAQEIRFSYFFSHARNATIGLGLGLAGYHNPSYKTLPLDFRAIFYPFYSSNSIEFDIGLGYALPIESSFKSGYRANIGLTWRPKITVKHNLGLSAGVSRQQLRSIFSGFTPGIGSRFTNIHSDEFYIGLNYVF